MPRLTNYKGEGMILSRKLTIGFFCLIMVVLFVTSGSNTIIAQDKQQTAKKISLIVINYLPSDSRADFSTSNSIVFDSFINQLKRSRDIDYTIQNEPTEGGSSDRAKVIKRAQAEQEKYVVWIQLERNAQTVSRRGQTAPDRIYVKYIVYAPKTADVIIQGQVEQEAISDLRRTNDTLGGKTLHDNSGRPIPSGPTIITGSSSTSFPSTKSPDVDTLGRAGRETARRVMKAFKV